MFDWDQNNENDLNFSDKREVTDPHDYSSESHDEILLPAYSKIKQSIWNCVLWYNFYVEKEFRATKRKSNNASKFKLFWINFYRK